MRPPDRFTIYRALAVIWVGAGVVGIYSYLHSYYNTRGFPRVARRPGVVAGRVLTVHFHSAALRREADYIVYLPTGYDPTRRYPVFYLLHGSPGQPDWFLHIANLDARLDNQISAGRVPPMLLVFPDGRVNGNSFSDSEWANTRKGRFEDYLLEVVRDVDGRFPTLAARRWRVVGGYSAGGIGALNLVLHHLRRFGGVQAWSGPFGETRGGVFRHASPALVRYYSPLLYAPALGPHLRVDPLRAFIYAGSRDKDRKRGARLAAELRAAGAEATFAAVAGGHDWELWNAEVDRMLILAGQDFLHPPPASVVHRHQLPRHRRPRHRHPRHRHPRHRHPRHRHPRPRPRHRPHPHR